MNASWWWSTFRSSSSLMEHLALRGINCPQPVHRRDGELPSAISSGHAPAAIVTFLDGVWMRRVEGTPLHGGR